jgi:tetratricopeptide (TPR) repeat protein
MLGMIGDLKMNSLFRLISIVFIYCSVSVVVHAQSSVFSEQAKLTCVEQIKERTAALVANDWPQLDRLAKHYVQSCRGAFDAADLSNAFEDIATANFEMLRFLDALEAANSCIKTYYANPGCHLQKVKTLIALDRLVEARGSFRIAERLIKHSLSQNESDLHTARNSVERELYLARKKKYEALLESVELLRTRYFID